MSPMLRCAQFGTAGAGRFACLGNLGCGSKADCGGPANDSCCIQFSDIGDVHTEDPGCNLAATPGKIAICADAKLCAAHATRCGS